MNPDFSGWRGYVRVEPPVLLFVFGQTVASAVTFSLLAQVVDPSTTFDQIWMAKSFVDELIPALLTLFLGPLSDKYGRKPLLVAACAGTAMSFLLWSILCSVGRLNPWTFLMASVPSILVGGYYSLILATYCYITDIRQESDRGWHLTWLQAALLVGQILGSYTGPQIWMNFGDATAFGVAFAANAIAAIYVLFLVPETVTRRDAKQSPCSCSVATWLIKRDGVDRVLIWCCVSALALSMLSVTGESGFAFLFTIERFNWGSRQYAWYLLANKILIITGLCLGGLTCKTLIDKTMTSMSIAVLANVSALAGSVTKAFTTEPWHFYFAAALGILGGLSGPMIRNALSKSAPRQDVGKVFSLATLVEAIIYLASGSIYGTVENSRTYSPYDRPPPYPSPTYLLSAALYISTILIVLLINWRISKLFKPKNPPNTAVYPEVH